MLAKLTYANVVATLALFVALGGSSYAAIKITGRNVKNGSLTSADIKNRSLLSRDFKGGQLPAGKAGATGATGAQGAAGKDATNLFAYVRDPFRADQSTAVLQYAKGVTALSDPPGNTPYTLTFDRSLVHCVVVAMQGSGDPAGDNMFAGDAIPAVIMGAGADNKVSVGFVSGNPAARVDSSFMVTAFC